jgi:hypothetical protein
MRRFAVYRIIGLTGAQLAFYVVLTCLLTLGALFVSWQMPRVKGVRDAVMMGFGSLGLFVGLILGLSASPIVNAFMGAAFTLAGILLPLFDKNPAAGANKARRVLWMMPFGFAGALGLFAGLAIRANDLLSAPKTPTRDALLAEGFSDDQVNNMLARWAEKATPAQILAPVEHKPRNPLLSSGGSPGGGTPPLAQAQLSVELRKSLADTTKLLSVDQRLTLLALDPALKEKIDDFRQTLSAEETLARLNAELAKQK